MSYVSRKLTWLANILFIYNIKTKITYHLIDEMKKINILIHSKYKYFQFPDINELNTVMEL